MDKKILMLGTFDTKADEFALLYSEIRKRGRQILTMNTGVMETKPSFPVDIEANEVALAGGVSLEELRKKGDRGYAVKVMCEGARNLTIKLFDEGKISGIAGMGGGGGTVIATTAMRSLPVGFPKLCISTLASGDVREYVGSKDIVLFPSIVDICGVNSFSRKIISRAAGAICGMSELEPPEGERDRPIVFISMFGSTTVCVEQCVSLLDGQGYDSMVFHAAGTGGRTMEELTMENYPVAVLDITTTEWADEVTGGFYSAGETRLDAPGKMKIPHLIVPGCVDMANFHSKETVPARYIEAGRLLYEWSPLATLMRTNGEENRRMGKIFAKKANNARGPVKFLLPLKGVSVLDKQGKPFFNPEADRLFFEAVKENVNAGIEVAEIDAHINDKEFSRKAVDMLLEMINTNKQELASKGGDQ